MIIDLILDRRDGVAYNAHKFYTDMYGYSGADDIQRAMDFGGENDVVRELARYIIDNEYNPIIIGFIECCTWLEDNDARTYPEIGRVWSMEQYNAIVDMYRKKYNI